MAIICPQPSGVQGPPKTRRPANHNGGSVLPRFFPFLFSLSLQEKRSVTAFLALPVGGSLTRSHQSGSWHTKLTIATRLSMCVSGVDNLAIASHNVSRRISSSLVRALMLCHPYADRVECHVGAKPQIIKPLVNKSTDRIAYSEVLHEKLVAFLQMKRVNHVSIECPNLGMGKKTVNRHVGEVTGVLVSAALQVGASVEMA